MNRGAWEPKSSLSLSFTNDMRDSYIDPTRGHKYTASIELAGGPLAGETDFVKLRGEARWFRRLTEKLVLMTRLEAAQQVVVLFHGLRRLLPPY